jgi:hypothetical protein
LREPPCLALPTERVSGREGIDAADDDMLPFIDGEPTAAMEPEFPLVSERVIRREGVDSAGCESLLSAEDEMVVVVGEMAVVDEILVAATPGGLPFVDGDGGAPTAGFNRVDLLLAGRGDETPQLESTASSICDSSSALGQRSRTSHRIALGSD